MPRLWTPTLGLFLLAAAADEPLEWKWKENDQFWVEYSSEYEDKSSLAGEGPKQHESVRGVFHLTVHKANRDGNVTLSVKVLKFNLSNLQGKPLAEKLEGSTFEVALDARLAITRISGLEKVVKALPGSENIEEAQFKFLQGILESLNRYWLTETFIAMPNKATKPGDQWEQKSTLNIEPIAQMIMHRTLKDGGGVKEEGKDLRKITMDVKFEVAPYKGENRLLPFTIEKVEVKKSECATTAYFDPAAGRLFKSASTQKYAMRLKMDVGGTAREVDTEREQTHSVRIVDKSPLK